MLCHSWCIWLINNWMTARSSHLGFGPTSSLWKDRKRVSGCTIKKVSSLKLWSSNKERLIISQCWRFIGSGAVHSGLDGMRKCCCSKRRWCGDEHGSTLGTNTLLLAAFQYYLAIQHTTFWPILICSEHSAIKQVPTLHLDLRTGIWSCLWSFYGSISTPSIWGFLQTVAANNWSVWYASHLWHIRSALVSQIKDSLTLCWLRTDYSLHL